MDDCSTTEHNFCGNAGRQSFKFGDTTVHFFFDDRKCYYLLSTITNDKINTFPRIIVPPQETLNPKIRTHTRAVSRSNSAIAWNKTFGFTPQEVIDKTLIPQSNLCLL